jgi:hypothetical protein
VSDTKVLNEARRAHRRVAVRFAVALRTGDDEEIERAELALEEAALVVAAAWLANTQHDLRKRRKENA